MENAIYKTRRPSLSGTRIQITLFSNTVVFLRRHSAFKNGSQALKTYPKLRGCAGRPWTPTGPRQDYMLFSSKFLRSRLVARSGHKPSESTNQIRQRAVIPFSFPEVRASVLPQLCHTPQQEQIITLICLLLSSHRPGFRSCHGPTTIAAARCPRYRPFSHSGKYKSPSPDS
jgi:hypothetical protein